MQTQEDVIRREGDLPPNINKTRRRHLRVEISSMTVGIPVAVSLRLIALAGDNISYMIPESNFATDLCRCHMASTGHLLPIDTVNRSRTAAISSSVPESRHRRRWDTADDHFYHRYLRQFRISMPLRQSYTRRSGKAGMSL